MEMTVVSGDGQDGSARATVRSNGGCRKSRRLENEGSVCVPSCRHDTDGVRMCTTCGHGKLNVIVKRMIMK
ncbi:proline-rich receptor-like protein kinase PERK8 [Iris pallida]|uniref:Proline-rich receptor-like protein kinase PERK8 n=1 Tax=Iris pallida TaxID=29817 RepID=A0AAX6DKH2_IRIPA|nr:proline-rich receptor-like protein kinase PERK8 [Iris pallida]